MIDAIILAVEYVAGVLGIPAILAHAVAVAAVLSAGCLGVIGKERRQRLMQALRKAGRRLRGNGGTTAALVLVVALGGCSAFQGNTLGETRIQTDFQGNSVKRIEAGGTLVKQMRESGLSGEQVATVMQAVTRPLPQRMSLTDGKDKASITWSVDVAKGKADYSASDVRATDPAKVRAAIAKEAGDDAVAAIEKALPGGISGLIKKLSSAGVL